MGLAAIIAIAASPLRQFVSMLIPSAPCDPALVSARGVKG
jgi:hypothetical protein